MSDERACVNTNRELWREVEGDYYAPSVFVTAGGGIGIDVGGMVYVKPVRDWHALASAPSAPQPTIAPEDDIHTGDDPRTDAVGEIFCALDELDRILEDPDVDERAEAMEQVQVARNALRTVNAIVIGVVRAESASQEESTMKPQIPTLTDLIGIGDRIIEIDEDGIVHVPQEEPTQANSTLIERLRARARIETAPEGLSTEELDAGWEDGPEVTWVEMQEIAALLIEAADALESLSSSAHVERPQLSAAPIDRPQEREDLREQAPWPDPTLEMLDDPKFEAVWQRIKSWDINVPDVYAGYCGATGNHVRAILDALAHADTQEERATCGAIDAERVPPPSVASPDACDDLCMLPAPDAITAAAEAITDPLKRELVEVGRKLAGWFCTSCGGSIATPSSTAACPDCGHNVFSNVPSLMPGSTP
jgi:hypothetical protein